MSLPYNGFLMILIGCALCACDSSNRLSGNDGSFVCANEENDKLLRWRIQEKDVLSGYSGMLLPSVYQVYILDTQQLKRYFSSADKSSSSVFIVPLGESHNCNEYQVSRSEILSDSLKRKYPGLVSLKGTGAGSNDIRLDYDGSLLRGQVISNGEMYYITPLNYRNSTYYLIYKRSDTKELKQEFEKP